MTTILLGILYIVISWLIFRFICRLLFRWVYTPLVYFCMDRDLNPSPWGFFVWELVVFLEYRFRVFSHYVIEVSHYTDWVTPQIYNIFLIVLAAIPLVIMLFQSRFIYFIPLLVVRIIGAPFIVVSLFVGLPDGCVRLKELPLVRKPGGQRGGGGYYPQPGDSSTPQPTGYGQGDSYGTPSGGGGSGGGYWVDPSSYDSSSPASYGDSDRYTSDNRQFDAQGEHREYDSDYSPMD